MERYGFHIIQASDALILKTRTGGWAVDRSNVNDLILEKYIVLITYMYIE